MSQIDSSMDPGLRSVMLSEILRFLPAFLSAASVERDGPVNAAAELLGLSESDLRRVLAVHIMLSRPVRDLVRELPTGIRKPIASSSRPRVAGRTVTSGIDWAATSRHRVTSSPIGDVWVTRPATRIFDIPENRALAWVLKTIEERGTVAAPPAGGASAAWGDDIRTMTQVAYQARRIAWLETVPAIWPGDDVYFRLNGDRTGFYKLRVIGAARYLRHIVNAPTPEDVVRALGERYFEPKQDWKLFEITILMRIARAISEVGTRIDPTRLFHNNRNRPFASFGLGTTREVRLWYQGWPPSSGSSELDDAVRYYELPAGGTRPDIVVEFLEAGQSIRAIILELKASASGSYLSTGLSQLLGYLRDRPALVSSPASGWLVVPPTANYASKSAGARALWVTSSSDVANAIQSVAVGTLPVAGA